MVKRILFVDHADGMGGAERSLLLLMSHLTQGKWEPHLAGVNGRFLSTAQQAGISVYPIELPRLRRSFHFSLDWWGGAHEIAALAKKTNADYLHANTVRAALYTSIAAKLARRPFIWHMRDFWLSEDKPAHLWLDNIGKRALIASAKHVIVNSNAVAQQLPVSDKIGVVHNGIDMSQFDPKRDGSAFREKFDIPGDVPLVGMVGRLRPWKGQQHFIQMAQLVKERIPNVWFVIVGGAVFSDDDTYLQQLQRLSQQLGLENQLVFTGQLNDVQAALAAFDLFVHPGDPEPFGLVNVEAMSMELPIVAFAHGALPEIVVHNETGLLVPPHDVSELATAVSTLLNDSNLAKRLGTAGKIRADQHFDIACTVKKFEEIVNDQGINL